MTAGQLGGYRQIFAYRAFRWFWLGYTASVVGDVMTRVALVWFVYEATHSTRALGWLMVAYTGPIVGGGLLAGWLLDRFDRRRVMLADSAFRGVVVALIPILHAAGRLALWHVYAVAGVYGFLMMISLAGGPAIVPTLVRGQHLATANALEMLGFTVSGVIGPPLAGYLITRLGAPNVVIFDALSYAAFACALAGIRRAVPREAHADGARRSHHLGDAVRLLRREPILLSTTAMFMCFNVGNGALSVWLPVFASRSLGGGASLYGGLLGALAAGEMVAALLAGNLRPPLSLGTLICLAQALSGVSLGALLLGRTIWSAVLALALFGLCSAPLTIWAQTLRMTIIPERLRGRTFALLRMLMQGTNPLGGAAAGVLAPVLGIAAVIGLSAIVVGLPGFAGYRVADLRLAGRPGDAPNIAAATEAAHTP